MDSQDLRAVLAVRVAGGGFARVSTEVQFREDGVLKKGTVEAIDFHAETVRLRMEDFSERTMPAGQVERQVPHDGPVQAQRILNCSKCRGHGRVRSKLVKHKPCSSCDGTGLTVMPVNPDSGAHRYGYGVPVSPVSSKEASLGFDHEDADSDPQGSGSRV